MEYKVEIVRVIEKYETWLVDAVDEDDAYAIWEEGTLIKEVEEEVENSVLRAVMEGE